MTAFLHFVHRASTAGGNGDTNDTTGPDRAYVSLAVAEAAEAQDLASGGHTQAFQCEGSTADTTQVAFGDDWTTGPTNNITVNPHANDVNPNPAYDTGLYRLEQSAGHTSCFKVTGSSCGHVEVNGIQMSIGAASSDCIRFDASVSGGIYTARGCRLKGSGSGSNQVGVFVAHTGNGTANIVNCVIYETGNECIELRSNAADTINVYSNTLDSAGSFGLSVSSGAAVVRAFNNLMTNCTTNDYSSSGSPTTGNNGSSDNSSPQTGLRGLDILYTDAANDDYSTSDSEIVGLGFDLSSDGEYAFSDDILGEPRGDDWDIGAFQHVPVGRVLRDPKLNFTRNLITR